MFVVVMVVVVVVVVVVGRRSRAVKVNLPLCYVTLPQSNIGIVQVKYKLVLFADWP
jgi:hypothetical protein